MPFNTTMTCRMSGILPVDARRWGQQGLKGRRGGIHKTIPRRWVDGLLVGSACGSSILGGEKKRSCPEPFHALKIHEIIRKEAVENFSESMLYTNKTKVAVCDERDHSEPDRQGLQR